MGKPPQTLGDDGVELRVFSSESSQSRQPFGGTWWVPKQPVVEWLPGQRDPLFGAVGLLGHVVTSPRQRHPVGINVRTYVPESDTGGLEGTLLVEQDRHPGFVDGDVKDRHVVGEHQSAVVTAAVLWVVPLDECLASSPSLRETLKDGDSAESRCRKIPLETTTVKDARVLDVPLL